MIQALSLQIIIKQFRMQPIGHVQIYQTTLIKFDRFFFTFLTILVLFARLKTNRNLMDKNETNVLHLIYLPECLKIIAAFITVV